MPPAENTVAEDNRRGDSKTWQACILGDRNRARSRTVAVLGVFTKRAALMSESQQELPGSGRPSEEKAPPYVAVVKTPSGTRVQHNLIDPWLAVALLEIGKQALLDEIKPKLIKPNGFPMGMLSKMGCG